MDLSGPVADWPEYGGTHAGRRYSPLDQITRENVGDLGVAWAYHHGDVSDGTGEFTRTSFQATPIVVDGTLYFCTGFNRVIALDPETGTERWSFDPELSVKRLEGPYPLTCRGVAAWQDPAASDGDACARRIFTGTVDSELIALDAATGVPCSDFGESGRVALREGIGEAPPWEYYPTSPPIVVNGVVVIGALVADNLRVDAPGGVVRGFDARSGALRWAWDPVPPGSAARPDGSYARGTPNVWSILSADPERDLVFVPTGNPSPDLYGGQRRGLDHFGSSVVALRAATGELAWSFQTVHHDLWDYDVAAQPTLFDFPSGTERVPTLVQATKTGQVFVLRRETGAPFLPIEERPVPQGGVPGEELSPTQPFSSLPAIHPQTLTPEDAWGFTPWDRGKCAEQIAALRSDGVYTPPTLEGSIQYPATTGGANWGGVAIDPAGVLFVNQSRIANVVQLIPREEFDALDAGDVVYPDELYPMAGTPYGVKRGWLLSPMGSPCTPPPWGSLMAVDLVAGKILWESTLGTSRDQAPFPMWLGLGTPNLGGPLATAGGLVFIGATTDHFLRAFDAETGEEVWSHRLPTTANATPMTYRLGADGRQYVVIAVGGHGWSEPGDALLAFALP